MSAPALPTHVITVRRTDITGKRLQMRLAKSFGTAQASLDDFEDLGEFENLAAGAGGTTSFLDPLWKFTTLGSDPEEVQVDAVRHYGEWLWDQLPRDFRKFYWSELHDQTGLSLAIWTDAMHFPWEMVWPRTTRTLGAPFGRSTSFESLFGLSFAISRWPWQREDLPHKAISPSPFTAYAPRNAVVGLAEIIECLTDDRVCQDVEGLKTKHGANLSAPATKKHVLATMESGAGLLHIRTHGGFGSGDSWFEVDFDEDADTADEPATLKAKEVSEKADDEGPFLKRTFVFLNSCQSSSQRATTDAEAGGRRWALALTRAGCDAFLGHYWDVNQRPATTASDLFYDRLKVNHDTLGEAALAVRKKTLTQAGSFTVDFLGYSLVGNPAQKIDF